MTRLERRDGYLWAQLPKQGLWLWGGLLVSRLAVTGIAHVTGAHVAAGTTAILLMLGLNRAAQALVVAPRAIAAGIPFAPEKDGTVFGASWFSRLRPDARVDQRCSAGCERTDRGEALAAGGVAVVAAGRQCSCSSPRSCSAPRRYRGRGIAELAIAAGGADRLVGERPPPGAVGATVAVRLLAGAHRRRWLCRHLSATTRACWRWRSSAMLAAGVDLPLAELLVVFLAGVLAVEIGAVSYGDTDLGTVLGYPALLAAARSCRALPARLPDPDRAGRGASRRDPPCAVRGRARRRADGALADRP